MASTVRKVLQYSPGSTGVLFASDCSTFRRGLESAPDVDACEYGELQCTEFS